MKMKQPTPLLLAALLPLAASAETATPWPGPVLHCSSQDSGDPTKLVAKFDSEPAQVSISSPGGSATLVGNVKHSHGFFETYAFTSEDQTAVLKLSKQNGCGRAGCWDDQPNPWHGKLSGSQGEAWFTCE